MSENESRGETPLVKVDDLTGLSGPMTTLIERIADGIAALYRSRDIIRRARAEAEAKIIEASSDLVIEEMMQGHGKQVREALVKAQEHNLGSILDRAAEQADEPFTTGAFDPDWIADFLNLAQNVSTEEMQQLWALLLTGELQQPGSFSRRTLHTVKLLKAYEARWFSTFCRYRWTIEAADGFQLTGAIIPQGEEPGLTEARFPDLDIDEIGHLEYIGLVNMHSTLHQETNDPFELAYAGRQYRVTPTGNDEFIVDTVTFTEAGGQLQHAIEAEPSEEYLSQTLDYIESRGFLIEQPEP